MFDRIQHIGYLVADLDAAVGWFEKSFGAEKAGGATLRDSVAVPGGGRNAFVRFGNAEMELIEPQDKGSLPANTLVMHHVGYVVPDIHRAITDLKGRGFKFAAAAPITNVMGQQLLYFDPATTNGCLMHLTQLPNPSGSPAPAPGCPIDHIVHAGYLVADVEDAVAWYEKSFDGAAIGGIGASRRGARNAYVNFGKVQVELIEVADPAERGGRPHVMDHVGLVVSDIAAGIADCRARGFQFVADAANTNRVGQQLLYFDTASTMGARMHLTQLPAD
jgi:catechol 2,3-dioxygenase-like lactoylglutathione lyase family enzyme